MKKLSTTDLKKQADNPKQNKATGLKMLLEKPATGSLTETQAEKKIRIERSAWGNTGI